MERIFLSPPHMTGKELKYIEEAFKSNYIAPVGEFLEKFEESIKNYTGTEAAVAVSSGTAAIHLALRILGVQENDKVIVSTFTFIGSVAPVLYQKAIPIFVDSDKYWNISPELFEEAVKKEKPKAAIITHLYGQSAKIDDIAYICKKYNVFLIEDAAESLGATYKGKHTGTFGEFGIFSFNGNKILTTGGGGILVSNNLEWIEKARFFSTQAKEKFPWYEHNTYGYNYRMSNITAAIGVAQMEVIEERIKRRREIFEIYRKKLSEIAEFMPEVPGSRGNRWLTTLLFKEKNPFEVMKILEKNSIESRPLWKPMHMQPLFKDAKVYDLGISSDFFQKGLCLPSGTQLSNNQIQNISQLILNC